MNKCLQSAVSAHYHVLTTIWCYEKKKKFIMEDVNERPITVYDWGVFELVL